jgi:hypothetical protein
VILRIEINGVEYWVDPTMTRQGGSSLQDNFFPNFHWGLPISQSAAGLTPLPSIAQEKPIEIHTSFLLTSEDTADLKIVCTFHRFNADFKRRHLEEHGLKKITEKNLDRIQKMYGGATPDSPVSIIDDRKQNTLTMTESYQIPIRRRSGKLMLKVYSSAISKYLDSDINPERSSPYALLYPCWVKEHIHIENPFFDMENKSNQYTYEHESLRYFHSCEMRDGSADLSFELQYLKDHVPIPSLREYWEITSDIEQDSVCNINEVFLYLPFE